MRVEDILARLEARQQRYALEALTKPSEKTEFEYGHRSGRVIGLQDAKEEILKLIEEENSREM